MKVLYKFEEKNIDILLQRRSLEYITDELLQDISKSLTKVEKNYQNLIDIQNQLESQTNRLSKHLDENATGSRPRRNSPGYCHSPDPGSLLILRF